MAFTFQSSARGQLEQMVLDDRFKLLTQLPLFAPMEIGLGLFAYLLFFASTGLYLGGASRCWDVVDQWLCHISLIHTFT